MKNILVRLALVGGVAAAVVTATGAFFSDTETSVENTFTAGEVDLKVDSTASYNASPVPTSTWASKDLEGEKFFNFSDIKPGDYGENTISLTSQDNDAWMCARIDNMQDLENTCNDPENDVSDPTCTATNGDGELAEGLEFFAWLDQGANPGFQGQENDATEGDNVWQQGAEPNLFSNVIGPASDVFDGVTYSLADSTTSGGPFLGGDTYYLGVAWCAGDLTNPGAGGNMVGNPGLNCDGSALGNIAQTDSVTADIAFYAEQWRNNSAFTCASAFNQ